MSTDASAWEDIDSLQSESMAQFSLAPLTPKNFLDASCSGSNYKFATSPLSVTLLNDESSDSFCDDFQTYDNCAFLALATQDQPIDMVLDIDIAVDFDMGSRDETDCESWFDCDKKWSDDQDYPIKGKVLPSPPSVKCFKDDVVVPVDRDTKVKQDVGTMTGSWFENMVEGTGLVQSNCDLDVLKNWFDDVDDQPMSIQDPITINFDIDVLGKADSENWFDVVERRYIEEMGQNTKISAI
jgi:hypothetical protein